MNIGFWIGIFMALALTLWGAYMSGTTAAVLNLHSVGIVLGGTLAATLINCPLANLLSAMQSLVALFLPVRLPTAEESLTEIVALARKSSAGGGVLSIREDSRDFAEGFLHRAIMVAIATGESNETRRIMEKEIKQIRIVRQEDANVFRTIGTLAPMFGIMGTLLGMVQVLGTLSEPAKVGPAMALALSSAFMGIGLANFICIPIAGQIRIWAMRETMILEILLEGVIDIAAGKPAYLIELHLASYSRERRREIEAAEAVPARPVSGAA